MTDENKEIAVQISDLATRSLAIKVTSDQTYVEADSLLSLHKAMQTKIKKYHEKMEDAAKATLKEIRDAKNSELEKTYVGEQHLKREIANYELVETSKRDAENMRLRAEAEKREEADRLTRAAEIEKEAARLKAEGKVAEAEIAQTMAEETLNTPSFVPPPMAAPLPKVKSSVRMIVDREAIQGYLDSMRPTDVPKISGISFYTIWNFDVMNDDLVPAQYKKPSVTGRV